MAPDSLPPPSHLSFLCISNKRAILRNYQRLLQPALQKMLSGKKEEREKKKLSLMRFIYGQELQTIQGTKINALPGQWGEGKHHGRQ